MENARWRAPRMPLAFDMRKRAMKREIFTWDDRAP